MSTIRYFPGCEPARQAEPAIIADFYRRSNASELRAVFLSDAQIRARTPTDEELKPFYGKPIERSLTLPFIARASLNYQGKVTRMALPNGKSFAPDWANLARAATHGGLCQGRVVTRALWVGPCDNEPWAGLENAGGFARGAVLDLCRALKVSGCELKLVKNLQVSFRASDASPGEDFSFLQLTLA